LDTIENGPNDYINIVVVQGYDKANKLNMNQIPKIIQDNIKSEIPEKNVYFLSENIFKDKDTNFKRVNSNKSGTK
jgi:hypothetical protein